MKNILLTLLLFILFSCKSTGDKTDCEVLHVDLVERPVPTEELFSKISVIPLETNDSSFLVRPVKVIIKDNILSMKGFRLCFLLMKKGTFCIK